MHIIAAKAVAFGEALRPDFKVYAQNVVDNARALASSLTERGLKIVSGGTDSHVMLVDLRPKKATGVSAEKVLDRAGITVNKNSIPGDPEKYTVTSGVRLGSPAGTTRGFGVAEFRQVGHLIADVLDGIAKNGPGRRRPGRGAGARQGPRPLCPFSDLPRLTTHKDKQGELSCAVHSAVTRTPRLRTRDRPTTTRRSAGGATARRADRASPPSSACSFGNSRW
jgi:glycine/serine hydroxymethyltransferase